MRDPSGAEVLVFARVLMPYPDERRAVAADTILSEVETADQQVRVIGRCHAAYGDGSLMSRCQMLAPMAEPLAHDRDFLLSILAACRALLRHSKS